MSGSAGGDAYRVELTPAARRQLDRLSGATLAALRGVILALAEQPLPVGAGKIGGARDLWRVRLRIDGRPWRLVYHIGRRERLIIVTRVVPRDEGTYRDLRR